jgi:hypothetical protein
MITEFDDIIEYLLDTGWVQYTDYDTGIGCKDLYKFFPTHAKCLTNPDKPGIQITCHVRHFVGITAYEFKLRGQTPSGWIKIHRYQLPDDFIKGIKVTKDMVTLWELANIPVVD